MTLTQRRNRLDLYGKQDLAELLDISPAMVSYYLLHGCLPQPTRGPARRKYYSGADMAEIAKAWVGPEAALKLAMLKTA